jgi:hypothetical protein
MMASPRSASSPTPIVAGQRGGERSLTMYTPPAKGVAWSRRVLDRGGMAGAGCAAAGFDACIGSATANLKWDEHAGKRQAAGILVGRAGRAR